MTKGSLAHSYCHAARYPCWQHLTCNPTMWRSMTLMTSSLYVSYSTTDYFDIDSDVAYSVNRASYPVIG